VSFDLSTIEGQALYYVGIVLTNYNSPLANAFTPPYPIGLAATAHLERISFTNEALAAQHQRIEPSSVTGPIVLELRYDDATRKVTAAISVDGGSTFAKVFDPLDVETDSGHVTVQTAVAALDGQCPAQQKIISATLSGFRNAPGQQRMKLRIANGAVAVNQGVRPVRLVLTDEGAAGATLYDILVPDRATAFQHPCGPSDGWFASGYVNVSGALSPACVPGSAQGLRSLKIKRGSKPDLRFDVRDAAIPTMIGPIRATIYDGPAPVNECDGWVGDAPCRVRANVAKCKSD
jgi:hypothetical protein